MATAGGAPERRPVAQQSEVGAFESNVAAELGLCAGLQVSVRAQTALPRKAEVESEIERRAGRSLQRRACVGQRLRAKDDRLGRDLGVDRRLALTALKRRRYNAGDQRHGARGRDPVLALAAHERVDIDLFGLERDADSGGRAENECGVPIRPDPSFLWSETKFRLSKGRLVEIGGHRSGDPPRGRRVLAGRRSC